MALYKLDQPYVGGTEAHEALGSGLRMLAQNKMQNMQQLIAQARTGQGLIGSGYTPEKAAQLSGLPPQALQQLIKEKSAEPGRKLYGEIARSLLAGKQSHMTSPVAMPEEQMAAQGAPAMEQPQAQQHIPGQTNAQPTAEPSGLGFNLPPEASGLNEKQFNDLANLAMKKQASEAKKEASEKKQAFSEKKFESQVGEKRRAYAKPIIDERRENDKKLTALNRMEQAADAEGGLDDPLYVGMLNFLGLGNVPALLTPGSQDFQGQVANFLTGLKAVFGARPTNFDVGTYLSKIPQLVNSPDGRRLLVNNWRKILQADNVYADERLKILKQNPQALPGDIDLMAYEATGPRIDEIFQQFDDEAQRIVSGKPAFDVGTFIESKEAKMLPKGTTGEINGQPVVWNGKAWQKEKA